MSEKGSPVETRRERITRRARRSRKVTLWLTLAPTLLLVAALGLTFLVLEATREPQGQVLARVNGVEITRADLMAEARAQARPDPSAVTQDLLDAAIARELLAQEARRRGLEHRPQFPSDRRRALSQLSAGALLRTLVSPPSPTDAEVDAFIAAHPDSFANRSRLLVAALRYPLVGAPDLAGLSLEEARARLHASGVRWTESETTVVNADLPQPMRHVLSAMVPNTTAQWRGDGFGKAFAVEAVEPAPLLGADARREALAEMVRAAREHQVADLITQLRRRALVRRRPQMDLIADGGFNHGAQ